MPKFPSVHAWAKFPKLIVRGINDLSVKTVSLVIRALRSIQKSGNRQVTAKMIRNTWTRNPLVILCTIYLFVSIQRSLSSLRLFHPVGQPFKGHRNHDQDNPEIDTHRAGVPETVSVA